MTPSLVGWLLILISVSLLIFFTLWFKKREGYQARKITGVDALKNARVAAIEGGKPQHFILGSQLFSQVYPGLGLSSLGGFSSYLDEETGIYGGLSVSGSDGSLVVLGRQIVHNRYHNGFYKTLQPQGARANLFGPSPLSFTAGLLSELGFYPPHTLSLFGNYGSESLLWAEAAASRGGYVFAAAGTIASQAALFIRVRDLLLGEEVFLVNGLLDPSPADRATWLTEDLVRMILMILLLLGAVLKMVGIL